MDFSFFWPHTLLVTLMFTTAASFPFFAWPSASASDDGTGDEAKQLDNRDLAAAFLAGEEAILKEEASPKVRLLSEVIREEQRQKALLQKSSDLIRKPNFHVRRPAEGELQAIIKLLGEHGQEQEQNIVDVTPDELMALLSDAVGDVHLPEAGEDRQRLMDSIKAMLQAQGFA